MDRHQLGLAFASSIGPLLQTWRRAGDRATLTYGISNAVSWPLLVISRHQQGIRQRTLACSLGIESPSVVRLIAQLEQEKLITRTTDPSDKRATLLTVTSKGKALSSELELVMKELRADVLQGVSDAELDTCLRVFNQLHKNLGTKQPDLVS